MNPRVSPPSALTELLAMVDEAFERKAWHGTTLLGSLRGLDAERAARRPRPGRHNIWELVVHAAYWKYTVRRRLTGEKRGSFPLAGSNWFERPAPGADFRSDVGLLVAQHQALRAAIAALPERALAERTGTITRDHLIRGIAAHDLYHAGQIQLLKRLV
ncbi:MAG: DinB family protein [Vicinamibacterales bacterium]